MASTEVEHRKSQPLKNKTSVVLRVSSVHCEGCKRKVKKLLQSVPGVDDIQIERLQQRVVVTGDVTPETLITKLVKSGKNAKLWPQKPPEIQESAVPGKEIKSPETQTEIPSDGVPAGNGSGKVDEGAEKKPNAEDNKASPTTAVEKHEQQNENKGTVVGDSGGVGEGKKKKKKKETSSSSTPQDIGVNGSNQRLPHQYPLPHDNYTPPPAPVNSYTASYYAPSPPPPQSYAYPHFGSEMPAPPTQSYAYSHFGSQMATPASVPSDYESNYRQPSVDSFEMFSDENPNGCLVM